MTRRPSGWVLALCPVVAWLGAAASSAGLANDDSLLAQWASQEPGITLLGLPASSPTGLSWFSGCGVAPSVGRMRHTSDSWPRTVPALTAEAAASQRWEELGPRDSLWVRAGERAVLPSNSEGLGLAMGLRFAVPAKSNTGTRASGARPAPAAGTEQEGVAGAPPLEPWCSGIVAALSRTASEGTVKVCSGPWRRLSGTGGTASACATIRRETVVSVSVSVDKRAGGWEASIAVNGEVVDSVADVQGPNEDGRPASCDMGGLLVGASPEHSGLPMRVHGAVLLDHGAASRGGHWWPHWLMTQGRSAVWEGPVGAQAAALRLAFERPSLLTSPPASSLSRKMWRTVAPSAGAGFAVALRIAPEEQQVAVVGARTRPAFAVQCGVLLVGSRWERVSDAQGERVQLLVLVRLELTEAETLAELQLPASLGAAGWIEVIASFGNDSMLRLQARPGDAGASTFIERRITGEQQLRWARFLAQQRFDTPGLSIGGPAPATTPKLGSLLRGQWSGGVDNVRVFAGRPHTAAAAQIARACGKAEVGPCVVESFAMDDIFLTSATSSLCASDADAAAPLDSCGKLWAWGSPPPARKAAAPPIVPESSLEAGLRASVRLQCVSSTGLACSVLILSIDPLLEAHDPAYSPPTRVTAGSVIRGRREDPRGPAGVWTVHLIVVGSSSEHHVQAWPVTQRITSCIVNGDAAEPANGRASCVTGTRQTRAFTVTGEPSPPRLLGADALTVSLGGLGVSDVDFNDATFGQAN